MSKPKTVNQVRPQEAFFALGVAVSSGMHLEGIQN